jgi:3-phenylpropionate/cinnamic acid dioxygenase small subunit
MDFLIDEARLLDHNRFDDWFELLDEDLLYRMPVRRTMLRAQGEGYDPVMAHFEDDYNSIKARVARLHSESAWSEDPASRVRRVISNVIVHETTDPNEYAVGSYTLALRSRWDEIPFDLIPVERDDLIRRTDSGFKIARRLMYITQSLLGTPNLGIFI